MNHTTDTADLAGNMTASGASLRSLIMEMCGYDPAAEKVFNWSNTLPCDECGICDSTALCRDDDHDVRVCYHCLVKW